MASSWQTSRQVPLPVIGSKTVAGRKKTRRSFMRFPPQLPGYDLNFHAPKSLSILHAMTGDERILTAFRSAVAETMTEIEALTATRVRRGGAQQERITGNLVWAE
jgi:conjugative relaxase-like TrwC/TraI family protein